MARPTNFIGGTTRRTGKSVNRIFYSIFLLQLQLRHNKDDNDIEEIIRMSKQKPNDSFDSFYDTMSAPEQPPEQPRIPSKLVRVLKSNLRPEIRYEILNIDINVNYFIKCKSTVYY